MKKFLLFFILGLLAAFFIWIITDDVDTCLDRGGCWDEVDKVCRKDEPNAQELCDRKKSP